nr:MAG TPA: Minor capsid protein [Caudoviricetes sp.]
MSARIKVEMKPVNAILARLGVNKTGDVQQFVTNTINRRITRYMPFRTGVLSTKLKFVKAPTEIEVLGPYARMMYYGKVMVDSATGKGPAKIPGVGYRFRRGAVLRATDRDLDYDKTKHPRAGPLWDRALMAAEGNQIAAEVQDYVNRKAGKR